MITVLGAGGFIGGHLVAHLRGQGSAVDAPPRLHDGYVDQLLGRPLGDVVYCIGLTSDFRARPFDTVEAHVGLLARILQSCDFRSLTYLSSTRVYVHSALTKEDAPVTVDPTVPEDIFNLSKLAGEALCLASGRQCRIARVSNVFGERDLSDNFLTSILRDVAATGRVTIGLSPESAKDYIDIDDAVRLIAKIAVSGAQRTYNVARGRNTSNRAIAERLVALGAAVDFAPGGRTIAFPPIDVERVSREFGAAQGDVTTRLPQLLAAAKSRA